jgi:TetR/AcrR family transcriptional regulator
MRVAELRRERRERDAEGAREAILRAAEEAFTRDGFSGARVDDIALAAGYNKALIFHYFDDKLGLYRALVARIKLQNTARITDLMHRYFPDDGSPPDPERVRDFVAQSVRWTFDMFLAHPALLRMLAWEAADGWQTYSACPPPPQRWPIAARDLIRRAQEVGIVRADVDPEMLIANIMGMTLIYLISVPRYQGLFPDKDLGSPEALARAREQIVGLVLHGALDPVAHTQLSMTTHQEASGEAGL